MFSSLITRLYKTDAQKNNTVPDKPQKHKQSINVLEHSILDIKGTFLKDFELFHHETRLLIDLLIFLPHYGLYFGEKISWTAEELKNAKVEPFSKKNKKNSTTRLKTTEKILHQKLEDVLSFDSTPIQRFLWMEHLCESEFDALHSSFQTLLSKERVIFADDDIQNIQEKLFSLNTYQEIPFSKLKVLGSLQAHTLLLPTLKNPFGAFLSNEQQTFLDAPIEMSTITILQGTATTGKSTVLIRKVLHALLKNSDTKAVIFTPTILSGEILRKEFISLCDFAAVTLDYSRLIFLTPPTPQETIDINPLPKDASIIIYDDFYPFNATFTDQFQANIQERSIFISSSLPSENHLCYFLTEVYRAPTVKNIQLSHAKEAIVSLLTQLEPLFQSETPISVLVVLPSEDLLLDYKKTIDDCFRIECQILTSSFSLQYKNLDSVTLATPQYIAGVCVPHCYVINLSIDTPEYSMALSRASHSVTVISEEIHSISH
ncbi:MAG TPA: hypothetical protein VFX68_08565 [Sulfuricurvum sp.]|nr:hypothetical protein [Sulfuricurvum sp.]